MAEVKRSAVSVVSVCEFFFAVRSVCLCRRKSWTREATLMYYLAGRYPSKSNCPVFIIFLFATAYVHCLIFLPGQLTPRKRNTNSTLKLVGRASSVSRLDSSLLMKGKRRELKIDWLLELFRSQRSRYMHLF